VDEPGGFESIPTALASPRVHRTVWAFWLIPVAAVAIGVWLGISSVLDRGPTITIRFRSAEGLDAAKTKLRFKDVDIGEVKSIGLTEDLGKVVVTAEIRKPFSELLVDDTRFWVVRPRIAAKGVSGLSTLFSGSYIGVDVGKSKESRKDFEGLDVPPVVTHDLRGKEFRLRGRDLGSLDVGSAVLYRRVAVGQVTAFDLDRNGRDVAFRIFVNAPYDRYVTADTRFWHASGFDVTVDANGVRLDTQSLVSILLGGVAFETPSAADGAKPTEATQDTEFILASNRVEAMQLLADDQAADYVMPFKGSVRGLSPGAPVDFRGVQLGDVKDIRVDFQGAGRDIDMAVVVRLYPARLRSLFHGAVADADRNAGQIVDALVARGLRAQLRNGNLLTGQRYVALDFFPRSEPVKVARDGGAAPRFPTVGGSNDTVQESIASLVAKLDRLPIDAIGQDLLRTVRHLDNAMRHADALLARADTDILPEVKTTVRDLGRAAKHTDELVQHLGKELSPEISAAVADTRRMLEGATRALTSASASLDTNSPLQIDARKALLEISAAARAMRGLGDYLERHPEALLRGKAVQER
jgi:paraquat-inducible protein B